MTASLTEPKNSLPDRELNYGITESSKDPPAVPPANLVGDAFGKRRPVGQCGGGSITAGTTGCGWVLGRVMSILEHNNLRNH